MNREDKIQAHFIHESKGLRSQRLVSFAPRVGDELRFADDVYYRVTRLVWVFDESDCPYSRLNIGMADA